MDQKPKPLEFRHTEKIDIAIQPNGMILFGFRRAESKGHLISMLFSADQARSLARTLLSTADRADQVALQTKPH